MCCEIVNTQNDAGILLPILEMIQANVYSVDISRV